VKPVKNNRWDLHDPNFTNVPTDTSLVSLFDTAYVHPLLRRSSLLWDYYDQWIKKMFFYISGTQYGLDQWVGGLPPEKLHISRGV
jgi:dimethylaniline monooxygenase (N-oxide forming)